MAGDCVCTLDNADNYIRLVVERHGLTILSVLSHSFHSLASLIPDRLTTQYGRAIFGVILLDDSAFADASSHPIVSVS